MDNDINQKIDITYKGIEVAKGYAFVEKLVLEGYDVTTETFNDGLNALRVTAHRPVRQPRHTQPERPQLIQG